MPLVVAIPVALLIAAWVVQAVLVAVQVGKVSLNLAHARRPKQDAYQPRAVVIVPFKGVDDDLPGNLRSLCTQNYRDYHLLLVVDSKNDPAYGVLQRELAQHPGCRAEILVSGEAGKHESQKIHNQLYALSHVTDEDKVLVFADSDAAPGPNWLMDMVGPLSQDRTGMTTAYRWLIPVGRRRWPSLFASVINAGVACAYRRGSWGQAWGGSMAVRADTARAGDLPSYLRGALTDDYQFTRMCRDLGKRVYFVPRAMAPTPVDFTWPSFFNFAYRQYLITRIYVPRLYLAALGITTLYILGLVAAWGVLIAALLQDPIDWLGASSGLAIGAVFIAHQVRTFFRRRVIRLAFGESYLQTLRPALLLEQWGTPIYMFLHWLIVLRAGFGRTMVWRNIRYRLNGPQDIERID